MPSSGDIKNCITAQAVAKTPMTVAACAMFSPTNPATSLGSTGPIMPNVSMSSMTVTKMKAVAARRLDPALGNVMLRLFRSGNVIERREPQIDGTIDASAVARRAQVEEKAAKARDQ